MSTGIQWTDETWNPVTGCTKVSPGCAHCYAETMAVRIWGKQYAVRYTDEAGDTDERARRFDEVWTHAERLEQPLRWRKPRRIFVNSMSDLFHEAVSDAFIDKVFAVMALARPHTFQILTKRAERMRDYCSRLPNRGCNHTVGSMTVQWGHMNLQPWPLPNVWLGVSVENQRFADERIPLLLQTPAAVRFISAEPLLEEVSLRWLAAWPGSVRGAALKPPPATSTDHLDGLRCLDWVIVGGESGAGARPFDLAWARSIVQQCHAAGVPVFMKQLGADPRGQAGVDFATERHDNGFPVHESRAVRTNGGMMLRDRKGGDPKEWPEDLRVREFPR